MKDLDAFFKPESVAIVGVSEDPTKLASVVFNNMREAGFAGKLYPINPKYSELFHQKAYARVSDVPDEVDMVVIVVPAVAVKEVLEDCGLKKVKGAIIITAGFKETGEVGKKLEEEIAEIAKNAEIRIIGPNCLGIIVPSTGVNASFAAGSPENGNIAFLSQSGAFCTAILDMAIPSNLGFSHFVSFGNKCDVDENCLLDYWLNDPSVKVIGAYIEEIKYGRQMLDQYFKVAEKKPVVILKPGQTEQAKKAMMSHTGSMAGSIQTFKTAIDQYNIIEATTVREMYNYLMGFSWSDPMVGKNVAIVTNAGGPGIIATDAVINAGLNIAELSEATKNELKTVLPPTASVKNPVDVVGDALADRYRNAMEVLEKAPEVDAIMVILTPQLVTQIEETARVVNIIAKITPKPIFPVLLGEKYTHTAIERFYDNKVPAFRDIEDAVDTMVALFKYYDGKPKLDKLASDILKVNPSNNFDMASRGKYHEAIKEEVAGKAIGSKPIADNETAPHSPQALSEELSAMIAAEAGIPLPNQIICNDLETALNFAQDIYPVVLKATNRAIPHKTDKKAVFVGIKNEEELTEAFESLMKTIEESSENPIREVLLQELVVSKESVFIGANRDGGNDIYQEPDRPGFGHLLAFGQGGIYTEIQKDLGFVLVPAASPQIKTAFEKTRISKIIAGARGQEPLKYDGVIDAIKAVQRMVLTYPEIVTLDINPLLVAKDKVVAVDIKIFV